MQKPIIKYNGARGALLCNSCKVIIKEDLTREEFEGKTNLLFCRKCKMNETPPFLNKKQAYVMHVLSALMILCALKLVHFGSVRAQSVTLTADAYISEEQIVALQLSVVALTCGLHLMCLFFSVMGWFAVRRIPWPEEDGVAA